jgi:hypothetical protein
MYKKIGRKLIITVSLLTAFLISIGQTKDTTSALFHDIKGMLIDSSSREPIVMASLSLNRQGDSSRAIAGVADKTGKFEFKNIAPGQYQLQVSSVAFGKNNILFTLSGPEKDIDLGSVSILTGTNMMEEVVITLAPITMNKDTVEFRASSFQTRPNSTVEDLLKKLPGVEVDNEGNVIANGDTIKRIFVDGKRFFGNDPKMATKNLTADMVDKLQLFEKLSDQAEFTGVDDGSGERVLNIKIKADRRKGAFGRATVGYGTDERFEASEVMNIFNGVRQVSIIGGINNINKQAFSEQDFSSPGSGGGGGRGGRGMGNMGGRGNNSSRGGIAINKSIGFNYNDEWSKKLKISGSYFFTQADRTNSTITSRQIFALDSSVLTNAEQINNNITSNHKFDLNLEYTLNPKTRITFKPNLTFAENESESVSKSASNSTNKYFLNSASNENMFSTRQPSVGGSVNYMHRFDKRNRSISISSDVNYNLSKGNGHNLGLIQKALASGMQTDSINQLILQDNENIRYGARLSYSEPLDSNRYIEMNVGINKSTSNTSRLAYAYNTVNSMYENLVTGQSNEVTSDFLRKSAGFNLRTQFKKYDYTIGINVQQSELSSINVIKKTNINQQQWNFFPTAGFNYSFDDTKRLRINYNGSSNQPNANQLQDIRDSTNLLNIRVGNPNLKPEFNHSMNFNYNVFDRKTFRSMFASVRLGTSQNKIINSSTLKNGISETMPINSNGFYNISGNLSFGLPIKPKVLTLNLATNSGYSYATSFQNGQKNISRSLTAGETVTLNFNLKDKLDLSANGSVYLVKASYSIDPLRNNNLYRYNASIDANYRLPKDFLVQAEVNYNAIKGSAAGFNKPFTMMNASLSKQFLKKKAATLKLSGFDLLRQNISINRNVSDLFIEDVRTNVLTQYFMLSFTYNFNRFGGNAGRQGNNMRPGGWRS